jgi:hypothetical protein
VNFRVRLAEGDLLAGDGYSDTVFRCGRPILCLVVVMDPKRRLVTHGSKKGSRSQHFYHWINMACRGCDGFEASNIIGEVMDV